MHNNSFTVTNFSYNKYLSNLDLLNKYILKTINILPKLFQIKCFLNLKEILFLTNNKKNINNNYAFKNAFFFFFSLFSIIPYIKAEIPFNTEKLMNQINYTLILKFNTFTQINNFLIFFFLENWDYLLQKNYFLKFNKPFYIFNKKNEISLFTKIPLSILCNYEFFYNFNMNYIIKENALLFVSFKFQCLNTTYDTKKAIKNLQFFWKNN